MGKGVWECCHRCHFEYRLAAAEAGRCLCRYGISQILRHRQDGSRLKTRRVLQEVRLGSWILGGCAPVSGQLADLLGRELFLEKCDRAVAKGVQGKVRGQ